MSENPFPEKTFAHDMHNVGVAFKVLGLNLLLGMWKLFSKILFRKHRKTALIEVQLKLDMKKFIKEINELRENYPYLFKDSK